jgi:hypothetical protein
MKWRVLAEGEAQKKNGCGRKLDDLERATTDNLTKGKKKTLPTKIFLTLFIWSTYYSIQPFIQFIQGVNIVYVLSCCCMSNTNRKLEWWQTMVLLLNGKF